MKLSSIVILGGFSVILFVQNVSATGLMLSSLIMGLKFGMGAMGLGGLGLMYLMAGQGLNQQNTGLRTLNSVPGKETPILQVKREVHSRNVRNLRNKRDLNLYEDTDTIEPAPVRNLNRENFARQIFSLRCLPKVLCNLNTKAPTEQSDSLNDFGYLIKTLFERDDDDDEDDENPKKKKKKGGTTNDDDGGSSEEEDDDYFVSSEKYKREESEEFTKGKTGATYDKYSNFDPVRLEELANEELLEEEPGMLNFILKDLKKKYPSASVSSIKSKYKDILDRNDDRDDTVYSKYIPFLGQSNKESTIDDDFKNDPFFADLPFRRRRDLKFTPETPKEALVEMAVRRARRLEFIDEKKKEIEEATDVKEELKIASQVGKRLRSGRQCRTLFNSCPLNSDEVSQRLNNLIKVIRGDEAYNGDQVIYLRPQGENKNNKGGSKISGTGNVINIQTGNPGNGLTKITHQLSNGNTVEILMRLNGKYTNGTIPITINRKTRPSTSQILELMKVPKTSENIERLNKTLSAIDKFNDFPGSSFEDNDQILSVPFANDFKETSFLAPPEVKTPSVVKIKTAPGIVTKTSSDISESSRDSKENEEENVNSHSGDIDEDGEQSNEEENEDGEEEEDDEEEEEESVEEENNSNNKNNNKNKNSTRINDTPANPERREKKKHGKKSDEATSRSEESSEEEFTDAEKNAMRDYIYKTKIRPFLKNKMHFAAMSKTTTEKPAPASFLASFLPSFISKNEEENGNNKKKQVKRPQMAFNRLQQQKLQQNKNKQQQQQLQALFANSNNKPIKYTNKGVGLGMRPANEQVISFDQAEDSSNSNSNVQDENGSNKRPSSKLRPYKILRNKTKKSKRKNKKRNKNRRPMRPIPPSFVPPSEEINDSI